MSGTPVDISASTEAKPVPKRMYSADIAKYIRKFVDSAPMNAAFRIPFRMPKPMFQVFNQIEQILFKCKTLKDISELSINHQETLGLSQEIIDNLTSKMFELVQMIEEADVDREGINHVSIGSLDNVGMSVLRRCFYVAQIVNTPTIVNPNANPYPFIQVDDGLRHYLCSLFMRIYAKKLHKQLFPLYAAGCLLFCCYTTFVGFNTKYPKDTYWQTYYNNVFDLVSRSALPKPRDERYWIKRQKANNNNQ